MYITTFSMPLFAIAFALSLLHNIQIWLFGSTGGNGVISMCNGIPMDILPVLFAKKCISITTSPVIIDEIKIGFVTICHFWSRTVPFSVAL